ncbi:MAG: spondin domain-containing protein [Geminicoccaceae bacterium]
MKLKTRLLASSVLGVAMAIPSLAFAQSIPSVVVKVENLAPERGTFQTPVWIGIHDGTFDIYDRDVAADTLLGPGVVEALAEDGNNGPITDTFEARNPGRPQANLLAPGGPFQPGSRSALTLQVDPSSDQYFSYGSMVIPSNDFFVANGNPLAHQLFNDGGNFVGQDIIVAGSEVLDAGTEVNDEVASNTAFLNQPALNTGADEGGTVVLGNGFAAPGSLAYPNGVLNHPAFAIGDFTADGYRTLGFQFQFVDLGRRVRLASDLSSDQEVSTVAVTSGGSGSARLTAGGGNHLNVQIRFRDTTGPLTMAHLHLGQEGTNGPVVVDLGSGIGNNEVTLRADASDVTGPLAETENPFLSLLNELAAGNIYINLHTEAFPAGELRGQVNLSER